MARVFALVYSLVTLCTVLVHAVSVFDGLRAANASLFAQWVQSNPTLAALYTSPNARTIFAPTDNAFQAFNSSTQRLRLKARQFSGDVTPQGSMQCSQKLETAGDAGANPGAVIPSNLNTSGNRKQVFVSHPNHSNSTASKRDLTTDPVRIFSGLGNNVSIVKADTPFDGGLIQTVDGFFTLPQSFNSTFSQTNSTSFRSGLATAGLSSMINDPNGVTVFSTNNDAFQAGAGNVTSASALSGILSNHIIPNFLGYTPNLKSGSVLTTQAGTQVTVTIRNGVYYINNARIVASDQITTNGVAHMVDRIITATPVFTGSAPSKGASVSTAAALTLSLLIAFAI